MKILILLTLLSTTAVATEFKAPSGSIETCLTASKSGESFGIKYSKSDLKKQKELCLLDAHQPEATFEYKGELRSVALCPKIVKTSPALEFFVVDNDLSKEEFLDQECSKKEKRGKKLAKYKVSTSCGYTPSMLGYYHFSRLLDIGQVPVGVLRSVDKSFHLEQARIGSKNTVNQPGWLHRNWESLLVELKNGRTSISHADGDKSFGALLENPKGESNYGAMYGSGVDGYTKHDLAKAVKKKGGIEKQFSKTFINLPKVFALKDYTDMLIFDAIMSQFDRYGNVDHWKYYYFIEDGKLQRKKFKKGNPELDLQMREKGAVLTKRMLLKDNDCGLVFRNRTIDDKALDKIRHFSKQSFENLEKLISSLNSPDFISWLMSELKFTQKDVSLVKTNANYVFGLIKEGVDSGKVFLDLNPEEFK